jgi:hypothetical protein
MKMNMNSCYYCLFCGLSLNKRHFVSWWVPNCPLYYTVAS